jgi:hypothetical protein
MSEYQYYEFQVVDRCLNEEEMNELRRFSSRADITPYNFINEYSWGSFKGDEDLWMEKYFDGFLYYANWGTHILKLRLPSALLDFNTVQSYCNGDQFSARQTDDKIILDLVSQNENGGEWEEGLRLAPFLSLRTDLIRGDHRCLYLGWLSGLQSDEYDEEEFEPSVPPGLQNLSPALIQLADFLRIDLDLINAAAQMSPSLEDMTPSAQDLQTWVCSLSQHQKDSMLKEILEGSLKGDQTIALQQICRFNKAWQSSLEGKNENFKKRTVGQLLRESENVRQTRIQLEAKKAAVELAERQRLQRIAREKRLNEIMGREEKIWNQIEVLASEKKAKSYDQALDLLVDLRDLAQREKSTDFSAKFDALKQRHSSKSSFIQRLRNVFV